MNNAAPVSSRVRAPAGVYFIPGAVGFEREVCMPDGKGISSKRSQGANASSPMKDTLSGKEKDRSLLALNALFPMDSSISDAITSITEVRQKAQSPMAVVLDGRLTRAQICPLDSEREATHLGCTRHHWLRHMWSYLLQYRFA